MLRKFSEVFDVIDMSAGEGGVFSPNGKIHTVDNEDLGPKGKYHEAKGNLRNLERKKSRIEARMRRNDTLARRIGAGVLIAGAAAPLAAAAYNQYKQNKGTRMKKVAYRKAFGDAYEFAMTKIAEGEEAPDNYNPYIARGLKSQANKHLGVGALIGLGGLATGIAAKSKPAAAIGALAGAAGIGSGLLNRHDAKRYETDSEFRDRTNKFGLFNRHNDLVLGNKMGMPTWMM